MAKILVVDDDSQTIEQLTRLIGEVGHRPDFLLESQYLFPKLAASPVDLLLLDVNMPDVNGLTLLKALKLHPDFQRIPVIMVTGDTDEQLLSECFQQGAVDFVNKPIRRLELSSRIAIALATAEHIQAIERQKTELALTRNFISTILDHIDDAICVIDDKTIREANQVFLNQVGLPREAVIGKRCFDKIPGQVHPCFSCAAPDVACPVEEARRSATPRESEHQHEIGERRCYTRVIITPIRNESGTVYLARDVTERRTMEERLKHLAFHDPLTGLPNRQLFFDRLHQGLAQARRHGDLLALLYFDLDRFKQVNDTHGHGVGDLLLKEVAQRLSTCVRESDTLARLAGDEFTAILTSLTDPNHVRRIAGKMLHTLSAPFLLEGISLTVTTSIGVSLFPHDGEDEDTLTRHADQALYHAKAEGRNTVQFHSVPASALFQARRSAP